MLKYNRVFFKTKKSSQKFYLGFSKPLDIDHYNEEIFLIISGSL